MVRIFDPLGYVWIAGLVGKFLLGFSWALCHYCYDAVGRSFLGKNEGPGLQSRLRNSLSRGLRKIKVLTWMYSTRAIVFSYKKMLVHLAFYELNYSICG